MRMCAQSIVHVLHPAALFASPRWCVVDLGGVGGRHGRAAAVPMSKPTERVSTAAAAAAESGAGEASEEHLPRARWCA